MTRKRMSTATGIFNILDPHNDLGISALHAAVGMHLTIAVLLFIRRYAPRALELQYGYPTFGYMSITEVGWDVRVFTATFAGVALWRWLRRRGMFNYQALRGFARQPLIQMDRIIAALMAITAVNRLTQAGAA